MHRQRYGRSTTGETTRNETGDYVRSESMGKEIYILRYSSREEPTNYSGDLSADTGTVILDNYIV